MHVHISWATALVAVLSWIVTVGALNLLYSTHPSAIGAKGWAKLNGH